MGWTNRRTEFQRRIRESLGPVGTFIYVLSLGTVVVSSVLAFFEDWSFLTLDSWMLWFITTSYVVFVVLTIVFYVRYKLISRKTSQDEKQDSSDRISYPTSYTEE